MNKIVAKFWLGIFLRNPFHIIERTGNQMPDNA